MTEHHLFEKHKMMMLRGGFYCLCDSCHVNRAVDKHEMIAKSQVGAKSAAYNLIHNGEVCALLCRDCHEGWTNGTWDEKKRKEFEDKLAEFILTLNTNPFTGECLTLTTIRQIQETAKTSVRLPEVWANRL